MTPVEVVQRQLDFYNSHDLEGFASTYSSDIKIYNLGEVTPFLNGIETLREMFGLQENNIEKRYKIHFEFYTFLLII